MKKIWAYVSAALAGMLAGVIIAVKWLNESGVTVNVKRIKNKKVSGSSDTTIPITVDNAEKRTRTRDMSRFQQYKNRRKAKKDAKAIRKRK